MPDLSDRHRLGVLRQCGCRSHIANLNPERPSSVARATRVRGSMTILHVPRERALARAVVGCPRVPTRSRPQRAAPFRPQRWSQSHAGNTPAGTLFVLPRITRVLIAKLGHRVSEPEIKLLLLGLLGLGGLATQAGSEAVPPAYVAGLVVAGVFLHDRVLMDRLRSIAFAPLTPFFFLRAGTLVSAPALVTGAGSSLPC